MLVCLHHPTITLAIMHTWTHEGVAGFYRGLAANLMHALLGRCVMLVIYNNIAWLLK